MVIEKDSLSELLKQLDKRILDFKLPLTHQEACGSGKSFWCSDYWTREVIRCLIEGNEKYRISATPEYLIDNTSFSIPDIESACDFKYHMMNLLEQNKDFSDTIMVCECGWGIDILLAATIKAWKRIICYDQNPYFIAEAERFHREVVELPVQIKEIKSHAIDFSKIDEKMILILEHPHLHIENYQQIRDNKNLLLIIQGKLLGDYLKDDGKIRELVNKEMKTNGN